MCDKRQGEPEQVLVTVVSDTTDAIAQWQVRDRQVFVEPAADAYNYLKTPAR